VLVVITVLSYELHLLQMLHLDHTLLVARLLAPCLSDLDDCLRLMQLYLLDVVAYHVLVSCCCFL
jgi:hypothetical protein